jgi:hypothetical protein
MSRPLVVLIAGSDLLDGLRARLLDDEVLSFADADVLRALEAIDLRRPSRVVLERAFASTSRGSALVNRLKADPALRELAVEVISMSSSATGPPAMPTAASVQPSVVVPPQPLDVRGTRRAPRTAIRDGLDIVVDGTAVRLVNLSVIGAQVVSAGVLKPNQKVRVSLVDESGSIRTGGIVVWASYELPRPGQPAAQYRAGLAFLDANAAAVGGFADRHGRRS